MTVATLKHRFSTRCIHRAVMALGIGIRANPVSSTLPAYTSDVPGDNPELPAWADAFSPTTSVITPASNCPAIANCTKQGKPNKAMAFAGDQITSDTVFRVWGQTTSGNGAFFDITPIYRNGNVGNFILDEGLALNSMYLAWAKNSNGYGLPFAINKTELWWVGVTRNAVPWNVAASGVVGDTLAIQGQNLSFSYAQTLHGTSQTSNTIAGSGTITWMGVETNLGWSNGDTILATDGTGKATITGTVTTYSAGTLAITATSSTGSGTFKVWTFTRFTTVATGTRTFAIGTGHNFAASQNAWLFDRRSPRQVMSGTVVSYTSGLLTVTVTSATGSGSSDLWHICGDCMIYLKPAGGAGVYVTPTQVSPYSVEFTIPGGLAQAGTSTTSRTITASGLPYDITFTTQSGLGYVAGLELVVFENVDSRVYFSGTVKSYVGTLLTMTVTSVGIPDTWDNWVICPKYQVWAHNGHGGQYGWTNGNTNTPLTLTIVPSYDYSGNTVSVADYATGFPAEASTSPVSYGTGNKTFALAANPGFAGGQTIYALDQTSIGAYMVGTFVSFSGGNLVVNMATASGSGSSSSWFLAIDNLAAFNSARSDAAAGNLTGTINVPAGRYYLSAQADDFLGGFGIGQWLKGAGKTATAIAPLPDFASDSIVRGGTQSKMSDLTVDFTNQFFGSSTTVSFGTGTKTFSIGTDPGVTNPAILPGEIILIFDYNSTSYMTATVTSFSSPTLVVSVSSVSGAAVSSNSWYFVIGAILGADNNEAIVGFSNLSSVAVYTLPYAAVFAFNSAGNSWFDACSFHGGGGDRGQPSIIASGLSTTVDMCDFYLSPFSEAGAELRGNANVRFTRNTAQNLPGLYSGGRLLYTNLAFSGKCQMGKYVGQNQTFDLGTTLGHGDANKGEQIMNEGGAGLATYVLTGATANTVSFTGARFSGLSADLAPYLGTIVSGKGAGQTARVTIDPGGAPGAQTITFDRNWAVIPDNTSRINFSRTMMEVAVWNNNLQSNGNVGDGSNNPAHTGVSWFAAACETYEDGNIVTDADQGFCVWYSLTPDVVGGFCAVPFFFNIALNNVGTGNNRGVRVDDSGPWNGLEEFTMLGCGFRDNVQTGIQLKGLFFHESGTVATDACFLDGGSITTAQGVPSGWDTTPRQGIGEYFTVSGNWNWLFYDTAFVGPGIGDPGYAGSKGLSHQTGFTELFVLDGQTSGAGYTNAMFSGFES